jgi:tetratricopeptide (TPR) repeat protein
LKKNHSLIKNNNKIIFITLVAILYHLMQFSFRLFYNKLKKQFLYPLTTAVILLCDIIQKVKPIVGTKYFFEISLIILITLLIIFCIGTFYEVENKEAPGFSVKLYEVSARRKARIARRICYIFYLLPLGLIAHILISINNESDNENRLCMQKNKQLGIIITSFDTLKHNADGFSSSLYGRLNSDLQFTDTVNLVEDERFIQEDQNDSASIKQTFEDHCSNHGLIIFGNRNDKDKFNCRIYSLNFLNFRATAYSKTKDKAIIYIQSPNVLNFTIDYESQVLAKFIFGLLYLKAGKFDLSIKSIKQSLKLNTNKNNTSYISMCHLFLGNNYLGKKDTANALKEYTLGKKTDPGNAFVFYNSAAVNNSNGNISSAFLDYQAANQIDNELKNPLKKIKNNPSIQRMKKNKIALKEPEKIALMSDTIKKVVAPVNWEEHYFTFQVNKKYGVLNNRGDTLVKCKFDEIISYVYKDADCFIVKLNNKYGAVIHKHTDYGYTLNNVKLEYPTLSRIMETCQYCVDHHD